MGPLIGSSVRGVLVLGVEEVPPNLRITDEWSLDKSIFDICGLLIWNECYEEVDYLILWVSVHIFLKMFGPGE